nr:MAG TPA: hypothetical protein [Bacteriophage sp.]
MCKYTPNKKGIRTKLNNFCALIVCIDLNCIIQRTFVRQCCFKRQFKYCILFN